MLNRRLEEMLFLLIILVITWIIFFSYGFRAVASCKSNLFCCLRDKDINIFLGFNYKQNFFRVFSEFLKKWWCQHNQSMHMMMNLHPEFTISLPCSSTGHSPFSFSELREVLCWSSCVICNVCVLEYGYCNVCYYQCQVF